MDEKIIRNSTNPNNKVNDIQQIDKVIAVNDMYLEAIQAKLKILDRI